jgi:hypothetical protein
MSMRAMAALIFVCLFAVQGISQDPHDAEKEVQCRFSNGKTITITYLTDHIRAARLTTNDDLITVKGINVLPVITGLFRQKTHRTTGS